MVRQNVKCIYIIRDKNYVFKCILLELPTTDYLVLVLKILNIIILLTNDSSGNTKRAINFQTAIHCCCWH